MKRIISFLLILTVVLGSFTGCSSSDTESISKDNDKITIVATLFPQYDFAREIAGDKADIKLLLPPGMESHSYEPTPGDIIEIQEADIFLYTGDEMEPWVAGIVDNIGETPLVADLSKGIELCKEEHDHEHENETETSEHVDEAEVDEHDHEEETDSHEGHNHEYNPHIWTSPVLAMEMVHHVEQALIAVDPENKDYYHENAHTYLHKLEELDEQFRTIVANSSQDTVYIGSRFSLLYFMEEYGLSYVAAYDSCEEEAEPSIKRVVSMIEDMRESGVNAIYYEELVEPYIAETIAEAAEAESLLFHTCHNLSKDEFEAGETYLSLMTQNAKNLKKGLN